jgi:hypothetical protein
MKSLEQQMEHHMKLKLKIRMEHHKKSLEQHRQRRGR